MTPLHTPETLIQRAKAEARWHISQGDRYTAWADQGHLHAKQYRGRGKKFHRVGRLIMELLSCLTAEHTLAVSSVAQEPADRDV